MEGFTKMINRFNLKDDTLESLKSLFTMSATKDNQEKSDKILRCQFIELIVRIAKQKYKDQSIDKALLLLIDNNLKGNSYEEIENEVCKIKK